ncbi:cation transport ATPase [Zymobacter palmae]|uniref:Cation transport ATPase n=1 Tax=Zymobacter palmae TaxID=33074 RepID=A0A348HGC8_9GAMM|nr:cation transport ATPase [Zymobacter palmae]
MFTDFDDFHAVGSALSAVVVATSDDHVVAFGAQTFLFDQFNRSAVNFRSRVFGSIKFDRYYAFVQRHAAQSTIGRRQCNDRQVGANARSNQRSVASFSQASYGCNAFQVVGSEHCRVSNGFVQTVERAIQTVVVATSFLQCFSTRNSAFHCFNSFDRIVTSCSFCRTHDSVSTVENGVTYVHDFCTSRQRSVDHGFQRLSGVDNRRVVHLSTLDHVFLCADQASIADFNTQVTTSNHDSVRCFDDAVEDFVGRNGFSTFYFSNETDGFADVALEVVGVLVQQLASVFHVSSRTREGDRDVVDAQFDGRLHVDLVFLGQCRSGQTAALLVDPFVVGQLAANQDFAVYFRCSHASDFEDQAAVVQQQYVAFEQVFCQIFVVTADLMLVTIGTTQVHVDDERLTNFKVDRAFFETCDTNFRTLQVTEDRNVTAIFGRGSAYGFYALTMFFRVAVREVDTDNVDTGFDHGVQNARFVGGRTKRRQNLGATNGLFLCLRHQVFLLCAKWRVVILHVFGIERGR